MEIKTAVHDGHVWQIGKMYDFSDDGSIWVPSNLVEINSAKSMPFGAKNCNWKYIRAIDAADLGTATPAPVVLVDGAPYIYIYIYGNGNKMVGFYSKQTNELGGLAITNCSNIRRLLEEN